MPLMMAHSAKHSNQAIRNFFGVDHGFQFRRMSTETG